LIIEAVLLRRTAVGNNFRSARFFCGDHADGIASMDLFMVPTISFRLLYGLLILHHDRRQILRLGVTAHPTAEWISHQLTEGWLPLLEAY
jgi:hypothetical protein